MTQIDQTGSGGGGRSPGCPVSASVSAQEDAPATALAQALGPGPHALILVFASLEADLPSLVATLGQAFPRTPICGCSTAGEITATGYDMGKIVAFAFPSRGFDAEVLVFEHIDQLDTRSVIGELLRARQSLARRAEARVNELAVLMVDGLSGQEDALVAALSGGLGTVPMVGGSAGVVTGASETVLFAEGRLLEKAAVLCLLRGVCEFRTFSLDHSRPTEARIVVTRADPEHRMVLEINDEPAAEEYARLLGLPPEDLSPYVFAAHPVLVRVGGRYYVRAIQGVGPDNSLVFFGAIAEGLVLTLGATDDIAGHLEQELAELARRRSPSAILGFDCFFRRIEAEGRQKVFEVSRILARHNVAGFSTFGEQIGAMHVNQTMTGVAFFPPEGN